VTACAVFGQATLKKKLVLENIAKNNSVQSQILKKFKSMILKMGQIFFTLFSAQQIFTT